MRLTSAGVGLGFVCQLRNELMVSSDAVIAKAMMNCLGRPVVSWGRDWRATRNMVETSAPTQSIRQIIRSFCGTIGF